jgi:sec-independent protein translocase protein TatB
MFGMGMPEIILILAIALIVLGPKKLPEIAKALGRGIAEFKRATQDLKESLDADDDLKEARDTIREAKGDIEETVRGSMTESLSPDNQGHGSTKDAVEEGDLEHTFEGDVKGPPQKPVQKEPGKKADDEASSGKEPSQDG